MATQMVEISAGTKQPVYDPSDYKNLTEWENEPRVRTLKDDFQAAKSSHSNMVNQITRWLDYLHVTGQAKPKVPVGSNRSRVQPPLVRKQAEWRYSALTESFLSSEKLFSVSPRTWEDEEGARQNEIVLNYQFQTKFKKVKFIDEFVRTTTNEGTAFVKLGWIRHTRMRTVKRPVFDFYPIESEEQQAALVQAIELQAKNPRAYRDLPEEVKAAVTYSQENGVSVTAVDTGEVVEEEEEQILENRPSLDIIDYNNIFIDPSCNGDIDKAKFAIVSFETCKADLKKDGRYTNLDKINYSGSTPIVSTDHHTNTPTDFNFSDESRKIIVAYEYWGFYDIEGNGVLEPIVATWVGDTMIRMDHNPFPDEKLPFVVVNYMPQKKKVNGEPDAELLAANQDIIGAVSRGQIDILARNANGQRGTVKGFLDVMNRRKYESGEDYEFNPGAEPSVAVHTHKMEELPQSSVLMLQMQNQEAESLTGVKAFSGGLSGEAYGKVAAGIRGMLDAASKREMSILRRMAEAMQEIGRKIISMNQAFLSEEETVRITNEEFIVVRREDLAGEFDLEVDISTPEVDEAKAQDLGFMLQTIGNNMDWQIRNMILSEIARLKRMPKLAHAIKNYQPEPDPVEEQLKQMNLENAYLTNQKLQMEIQELQSRIPENDSKAQLNIAKAREAGSNADLKDLDFVETETGTKHAREMQKQGQQARANQKLEVTKALLSPKKEGESNRDIEAAIGYNAISDFDEEYS